MSRAFVPHHISDDSALGGSVIERSLRINSGDSAYLYRNHSTDGNRRTFTISFWTKKSNMSDSGRVIFQSRLDSNSSDQLQIQLRTGYQIRVLGNTGGSVVLLLDTTPVFRDSSAWYHIVLAVDTTQGTASDRNKLYVNGTQITQFESSSYPSSYAQNTETPVNQASSRRHLIGCQRPNSSSTLNAFMDGYLAEFNLIDGLQLDPSYFGYTESQTGIWRPKKYVGAYGTNGFLLDFSDSSAIGYDNSSNSNSFTVTNFVATDVLKDTPTNNFATYDPLAESGGTYSEGNLKVVSTADPASSTIGLASGKFYYEVYVDATDNMYVGVIPIDFGLDPGRGGGWDHGAIAYKFNGDQYSLTSGSSSVTASYGASYTAGDIIGCAVDIDNDTITFYKNGVSQGNTTNGPSYISPSSGNVSKTDEQIYGAIVYSNGGNNIMRANFGQDSTFQGTVSAGGNKDASGLGDFKYAVPSGHLALCSNNLSVNTSIGKAIIRPQKHFDTLLYTGNGSNANDTQNITGLQFKPDLVWIKSRSATGHHSWIDSVRGDMALNSDQNIAQYSVAAFNINDNNSIDVPHYTNAYSMNANTETYVAWCWKAGGNSNTFNVDGKGYATQAAAGIHAGDLSLTGASVNTKSGFSIITWTGDDNASADVGTGLSSDKTLSMAIVKKTSTTSDWQVGHNASGQRLNFAYHYNLNDNSYLSSSSPYHMASQSSTNGDRLYLAGDGAENTVTYVAYIWQERPGYSKFGRYYGNGNDDGIFVYTGFKVAYLMVKRSSNSEDWQIFDNMRGPDNAIKDRLEANSDGAEDTSTEWCDFLSNGFKHRNVDGSSINGNNNRYIYMAFAEQPGNTSYGTETNAR